MTKEASTDFPTHEFIAKRWSPNGFDDRAVSQADLCRLLEAARWAPSSYKEQPWGYIVATKDNPDGFAKLLSCLLEGNQEWAKAASVLMLGCTRLHFSRIGKSNKAAAHDLGLAAGNLFLEATARGLCVHQMIGIEPDRVRELYRVAEGVQPLNGWQLGTRLHQKPCRKSSESGISRLESARPWRSLSLVANGDRPRARSCSRHMPQASARAAA